MKQVSSVRCGFSTMEKYKCASGGVSRSPNSERDDQDRPLIRAAGVSLPAGIEE